MIYSVGVNRLFFFIFFIFARNERKCDLNRPYLGRERRIEHAMVLLRIDYLSVSGS